MGDMNDDQRDRGSRFAYFMVRIQSGHGDERAYPTGIVERLGSGRKESFSGTAELLRLLTQSPTVAPNMEGRNTTGNARATSQRTREAE